LLCSSCSRDHRVPAARDGRRGTDGGVPLRGPGRGQPAHQVAARGQPVTAQLARAARPHAAALQGRAGGRGSVRLHSGERGGNGGGRRQTQD